MRPPLIHALIAIATAGCGVSRAQTTAETLPTPRSVAVGASCDRVKEAYACMADRETLLVCDAARWRVAARCSGVEHCVTRSSTIKCDETISEVSAPCAADGDSACSSDGSRLLECTSGAMVETSRCRGAKGCAVVAGVPTCDRTSAEVGDACGAEGEVACTVKGDAIVECRHKVMVQSTVCSCRVDVAGMSVRCVP